jgi:peptidoglycan/xylan/chitin deacetylase (PgdA/CDA1 family)
MDQRIKHFITDTLGRINKSKSKTFILNGHDFNMPNIKLKDKKSKMNALIIELSKKYRLIGLDEAVFNIENSDFKRPEIAFTFDDGFSECYEIAEVLSDNKITGGFFISTAYHFNNESSIKLPLHKFKKTFLNKKEIKMISNSGHIIGTHTSSHLSLNKINSDNFYSEIIEPKKLLEKFLNFDCEYFAPPYGVCENLSNDLLLKIQNEYNYIFWSNNKNLSSLEKNGFNRRHFELDWSANSINYFLSKYK